MPRISSLPPATLPLDGTEQVPVVQGGVTKRTTTDAVGDTVLNNLAASAGSSLVGHIATGAGAATRTVQAKLRDVVSVKDFGAVGDGTADDQPEIAATLAAHKGVNLPFGTYRLGTALTLTTPCSIRSDDWRTIFTNKGIHLSPSNARYGMFQGFGLEGDDTGAGWKMTNAIDYTVMLRRVRDYEFGGDLDFSYLNEFIGGEFSFNVTGMRLKNFSNANVFINTAFSNNSGDGLVVLSSQACTFLNLDVESNGGWGVVIDNADNATLQNYGHNFIGGYVETNVAVTSAQGDFFIGRGANAVLTRDVTLQGVSHFGQKPYGYFVDYAFGTRILYPNLAGATYSVSPIRLTANSRNTTIKGVAMSQVSAASGATVSIDTVQFGTVDVVLDGGGFGDVSINFPIQYHETPPVNLQLFSDGLPAGSLGTANIKNGIGTTGFYVQVIGGPGSQTVRLQWRAGR